MKSTASQALQDPHAHMALVRRRAPRGLGDSAVGVGTKGAYLNNYQYCLEGSLS